jgi:hypothetical protein
MCRLISVIRARMSEDFHLILHKNTIFEQFIFFWRIRKIAKSEYELHHACLSVRTELFSSQRKNFTEFYIWVFFENLSRKFKFH